MADDNIHANTIATEPRSINPTSQQRWISTNKVDDIEVDDSIEIIATK
jgi:hypothetical protein